MRKRCVAEKWACIDDSEYYLETLHEDTRVDGKS